MPDPLLVRDNADVETFFDREAQTYAEKHGPARKRLAYRLRLLRKHACFNPDDAVLDLGCGPGNHLIPLLGEVGTGWGADLSPEMIARARQAAAASHWKDRATFITGRAEHLDAVPEKRFNVVVSVGALEHMIDQQAALATCCRVLKPGGRFICLTPNGDFLWYRTLAPLWKQPTRRLSTDHYLGRREAAALLRAAGFATIRLHYWTFIPKGDMTPLQGVLMHGLDHLGRLLPLSSLRSGLILTARKAPA